MDFNEYDIFGLELEQEKYSIAVGFKKHLNRLNLKKEAITQENVFLYFYLMYKDPTWEDIDILYNNILNIYDDCRQVFLEHEWYEQLHLLKDVEFELRNGIFKR